LPLWAEVHACLSSWRAEMRTPAIIMLPYEPFQDPVVSCLLLLNPAMRLPPLLLVT
jgi:hypothetical protein